MIKKPAVLIGVGEMGGVFARGLLRLGHPVYPVTRSGSMSELAAQLPDPELALIAVAEADLQPTLAQVPDPWRDRLGLLQNELLPHDWEGFPQPTVISVWFEKKRGQDVKVIVPSPVYGGKARLLAGGVAMAARLLQHLANGHRWFFGILFGHSSPIDIMITVGIFRMWVMCSVFRH